MSKDWTITRVWEGQTCAVFASGESLTPAVIEAVRMRTDIRVIAVNRSWEVARWADILYAADAPWWTARLNHLAGKTNYENAAGFMGIKVCVEDTPYADVRKLRDGGQEGFDPDPGTIRTGGNSGYGGIHIAAHMGAKRILLCGFDMRGEHWHEPHQAPLRQHGHGIFERWIPRFKTLAPELKRRGIEVLNVTPGSALKCFSMMDLSEALETRAPLAA